MGDLVHKKLKVVLVTTFPPSVGDLNEYGFHLASALRDDPSVELFLCADKVATHPEADGFAICRCWTFNSMLTPYRILRFVWQKKPDCVWFNMGFSTFANSPIAAFVSMFTPALVKHSGSYTHITLHTIFERISLADARIKFVALFKIAGRAATRVLLWSGDISVLLPTFRRVLLDTYRVPGDQIHYQPHGTFANDKVDHSHILEPRQPIVLAFGYWGTYKRVEALILAMQEVLKVFPLATLEIAGKDHPSTPGYLKALRAKHQDNPSIRFLGYIPEDDVSTVFGRARVVVLPYTSAAGTSGVVHQACQYALPIIATKIEEFTEIAREEGVAMAFYSHDNSDALATEILQVLTSDKTAQSMARQNLKAASASPMRDIVGAYLQLFRTRLEKMAGV